MQASRDYTEIGALAQQLDLRLEQALGPRAWLGRTPAGNAVVIKSGPGAAASLCDFLRTCKALYPAFDYPRIISAKPDLYLVYDFIPGEPLSRRDFESKANLTAAFELSGRVTALCRSLKLAPMFQGLQNQAAADSGPSGVSARRLAALGSGLDCQVDGLAVRRWEASQSYAWAQDLVAYCQASWPQADAGMAPRWPALRRRVESVTSIHLTVPGSNLAHTCFTPEHVLATGDNRWGLVGWQVAPRPYNFMRYAYLAWCLVHTSRGDIAGRYREYVQTIPTMHTAAANVLTFALSLLAAWLEAGETVELRAEKLQALLSFVDAALEEPEAERQFG